MKVLQKEKILSLVNFNKIFEETKEGFIKFSNNETITPPFTVFSIPENDGSVHLKCGYVQGSKTFSLKYSGVFYGNLETKESPFSGFFIVFNANNGNAELIIDDKGYLTDYRTGIAGAIATKALANPDSKNVAVIGTGIQARMQIDALLKVMPIKQINIYGRNMENAQSFEKDLQTKYQNIQTKVFTDVQSAVKNADIIYTVTYSKKPILMKEWVSPGTHITAIGACDPNMQELDPQILKISDLVVVDSKIASSTHGELHHALNRNLIDINKVKELGSIIQTGIKRNKQDITVCDLVGLGFQDAIIGNHVYEAYFNYNK